MRVHFHETAQREFDEAIAHYEQQMPGLGQRYRKAVKDTLERIKQFPEAYTPLSERTRRCLVNGFPYGIIYQLKENDIIVVAVAHLHRKPEYWTTRGR